MLQFPAEALASAPRTLNLVLVRTALQAGGNTALCAALLAQRGVTAPPGFEFSDCPADLQARVRAGQGTIHWASQARPLECRDSCFGRPFFSQTTERLRPNLRQVHVFGRLNFVIDSVVDRSVSYGYLLAATCEAVNGSRGGRVRIQIRFDEPVVGEPGLLESIISFFTVGRLSDFITRRIQDGLRRINTQTITQGSCRSIGISRALSNPTFDELVWDLPPALPQIAGAQIGQRARVEFFGVRRNPVFPASAANPPPFEPDLPRQFTVFLNGQIVALPPINLPPAGGDQVLNLCRTIDVRGWDRLQILFVNGLGGAVWSQFSRSDGFGSGGLRRMTTGRRFLQPALPPPPGEPGNSRPFVTNLREFELRYRITFIGDPVIGTTSTGGVGQPPVNANPDAPPAQPCREI